MRNTGKTYLLPLHHARSTKGFDKVETAVDGVPWKTADDTATRMSTTYVSLRLAEVMLRISNNN
eukprot:1299637-Amphidinium_carterae.1